ncbi:Uncharacterised protein [Candidatus Gugararchaeum adminiculabundum]|nr:Uncharacterised protein [Candidatus Gugararchaeum adminiculabundum]
MVLGKNKGHTYEDKIFEILESSGLLFPGTVKEGMAGGVDAVFCHLGKPYNLEVKNGLSADYGQKKFNWSKKEGWTWSENDDTTRLYSLLKVLQRVRNKNIVPRRYSKEKTRITYKDAEIDQKAFEDRTCIVKAESLWKYYGEKDAHYIQVGSGYGFYHLDRDVAKLGTEQFNSDFILRFRAKYHDRVDRQGGTLVPTPWNYSFFAVLKVKSKPKPKRSKYNLEESDDQEFPPIAP